MAPVELRVSVVFCPDEHTVDESPLVLKEGATLRQALQESGLGERHAVVAEALRLLDDESLAPEEPGAAAAGAPCRFGVWGRLKPAGYLLRDGDRVEVYRPLQVDPMEARRRRQREQRGGAASRKAAG